MWKKIGAVGPNSNDNKSSRSKDQNAYQPFSQLSKLRMNQSQIFFQQTQYFCPNYLNKKRNSESKYLSQSRLPSSKELQHAKSFKEISTDYKQSNNNIKKKPLNQSQIQDLKNRLSRQLIEQIGDVEKVKNIKYQQNFRATESTEMIGSQTSIQSNMKKLKQCKSTPQFNFNQIPSITQEISLDKKIQAQKNINSLKKQHSQIQKMVKKQLIQFKKSFNLIQGEIQMKISQVIQQNNLKVLNDKKLFELKSNKKLNFQQLYSQTKKFGQNLNKINQKKAQLMNKYMSLRVK